MTTTRLECDGEKTSTLITHSLFNDRTHPEATDAGIFNQPRYNLLSSAGSYQLEYRKHRYYYDPSTEPCIFIASISSHNKGSGFGTAVIRKAVEQSIEAKCPGNLYVEASWSSHLFYLYMGMVPSQNEEQFFDDLLTVLKENIGNKYPDTSRLRGVPMVLSIEGEKRWLECIREGKNFEPFKKLEHITKPILEDLSEQNEYTESDYRQINQIKLLDEIFTEKALFNQNNRSNARQLK